MLVSRIFVLLALLSLAGCGFSPVYSTKSSVTTSAQLKSIQVAPVKRRTAQLVRNQLLTQFSSKGYVQSPEFFLTLRVSESLSSVLIRRSTDIQRRNLTVRANYILQTADKKIVLTKGRTVAIAPYNLVNEDFGTITSSDFANVSARKNAQKKASIAVADDIARRLAAFFATRT